MLTLPPRYHPSLEQIGQGGFGVVYKTIDQVLGIDVAVKVPYRNRGNEVDDELHREVATELQAAAILRHPAIIQMLDGGVTQEGNSFLVMEYAGAGSMQQWIHDGPPPWDDLAPVLDALLAGLGHAHAANLVHRDIKAENILLSEGSDGSLQPKIADFGLAKVMERRGYRSTRMGAGTLLYMPPEQFEDDTSSIHPGADLYAFGVLAYMLLAGRPPYEGAGEFAMIFSKVNNPPAPFTPRPEYAAPAGLERWMRRLLEPDPADRYHLAADVRSDLRYLLGRTEAVPALPSEARSLTIDKPLLTATPALPEAPAELPAPPPIPPSAAMTGFRMPRFVNREQERAALWASARAATQQARAVRVGGPVGSGRSRLCGWLAQVLEEQGHARTLQVRLDPDAGISDALARALRNFIYLGNLRGAALSKRIGAWLRARGHREEADAAALARWLDPDATHDGGGPGASLQGRLALVDRVLHTEARRGLVAVWIEDRRSDFGGARLAQDLVRAAQASRFPLLVFWEPPGGDGSVTTARDFDDVTVQPMALEHIALLVGELLPPGPVLEEVISQSGGNPRLAVETARLEAGNPSAWPDPEAAKTSSLTMHALDDSSRDPTVESEAPTVNWAQRSLQHIGRVRLEAFVGGAGAANRSETLLQLLAVLPRPVPPSVLEAALAGASPSESGPSFGAVVDNARAAGLVVALPDGSFDFASAPLAEGARDLLLQDERRSAVRRAAAEALLAKGGDGSKAAAAAGRLFLDAGDAGRALDLLSDAAERLVTWDVEAARSTFVAAADAASALTLSLSDPRRVNAVLGAARSARNSGDLEGAATLLSGLEAATLPDDQAGRFLEVRATLELASGGLDLAIETAREGLKRLGADGDLLGRARTRATLGEALLRRGELPEAKSSLQKALELARQAGDLRVELDCLERLARTMRAAGDTEGARDGFGLVLDVAQGLGDLRLEGVALRNLGRMELEAGRYEAAEERLRQSVERLDRAGFRTESATTRSEIGELARAQNRLTDARKEYGATLSVARAYGATGIRLVALFNLGLTEIGLKKPTRAQRRLAEIDELVAPSDPHRFRPYFEALRLAVLAGTGDYDDAATVLDDILDEAWGPFPADRDVLYLLERAAEYASRSDDTLLSGDACQLGVELAEEAGDSGTIARFKALQSKLG